MLKTADEEHGWSICLASGWPRKVDTEDVLAEKRIPVSPEEAIGLAQMCTRRRAMDGVYLNGACPGCPMKHRLDLECLS